MSPEQCAGARMVDTRTDIYALGCILFEMVVGRRPFVYQGWGEYIAAHQNESPPNPTALRPALPPALNDLILQMLAKRPEDRPSAMSEIQRRLTAVRESLGAPPAAAPPQPPQVEVVPPAERPPAPARPKRRAAPARRAKTPQNDRFRGFEDL